MDISSTLALGSAWASGLNLYLTTFMLGFMNNTGTLDLLPDLQVFGFIGRLFGGDKDQDAETTKTESGGKGASGDPPT